MAPTTPWHHLVRTLKVLSQFGYEQLRPNTQACAAPAGDTPGHPVKQPCMHTHLHTHSVAM